MVWYSHFFKSFPQFVLIHTVKGFSIVNETEVDVFLEFPSFSMIQLAQSCPTLCDPVDCSPAGSSVHGILQARILEWVAISISRDLPNPGIKPGSPALQADALSSEPAGKPYNPTDVGNLISGSSAFSKSSLNTWKFLIHIILKPSLEDFEYNLTIRYL